jgi:histone H3/H4
MDGERDTNFQNLARQLLMLRRSLKRDRTAIVDAVPKGMSKDAVKKTLDHLEETLAELAETAAEVQAKIDLAYLLE